MIYDLPNDKVSLSFPSQDNDENNRSLWLTILPPLVMLLVMGTVSIIQPREFYYYICHDVYDHADCIYRSIFQR